MVLCNLRNVRQVLRVRLFSIEAFVNRVSTDRFFVEGPPYEKPNPPALFIEESMGVTAEDRISRTEIITFVRGFYRVYGPQKEGTEAIDDLGFEIAQSYNLVAALQGQGLTIYLDRVERLAFREDGPIWHYQPMEFALRIHSHETQAPS